MSILDFFVKVWGNKFTITEKSVFKYGKFRRISIMRKKRVLINMAHLHDMEELVNSVEDNQVKDYMEEALSCYMANAYRACIVLTYIALFDDIVKKLGELGKVNKKARIIYDEAQKKINAQDVYESYVIDQLKANSLLPALDTTFLDTLRVLRNKSAHPSGHNASAEEARFIFYEAIQRFLSKPILTTTQLVDEILARLDEKHFFPSTDISKISAVVKKELENIHHEAFPYLMSKFLEKSLSTNSDVSKNAGFFLTGLAYLKDEKTSEYIKKYAIEAKCSDSKYSLLILRLVSANGALLLDLDVVTYDRLKSVIAERVDGVESSLEHTRFSHPSSVLKSILECCGEELLLEKFKDELIGFLKKNVLSSYFVAHMVGSPKVIDIYLKVACEKAGSSDYDTANHFSRNLKDLDQYLPQSITDEQAFLLLVNVLRSADWGAWGAKSLRDSKFSSIPEIRKKAIDFANSDNQAAKEKYIEVSGNDLNFEESIKEYFSNNA